MAHLWNLTFKTKMKSPSSKLPYYTQIWVKNNVNIADLIDELTPHLANNCKIQASEVRLPRPTEAQYELPAIGDRENENIISLGWKIKGDPDSATYATVPCLKQDVTVDQVNAILSQYVCGASSDGSANPEIDADYFYQKSQAVTYVAAE